MERWTRPREWPHWSAGGACYQCRTRPIKGRSDSSVTHCWKRCRSLPWRRQIMCLSLLRKLGFIFEDCKADSLFPTDNYFEDTNWKLCKKGDLSKPIRHSSSDLSTAWGDLLDQGRPRSRNGLQHQPPDSSQRTPVNFTDSDENFRQRRNVQSPWRQTKDTAMFDKVVECGVLKHSKLFFYAPGTKRGGELFLPGLQSQPAP